MSLLRPIYIRNHVLIYRLTRGAVGGKVRGLRALLLITKGRQTGKERTVALSYFMDGGDYIVVGSFAGRPRHPGWVHNLMADPKAVIQTGGTKRKVVATMPEGEERERLWERAVELQPMFGGYRQLTTRVIKMVVLSVEEAE